MRLAAWECESLPWGILRRQAKIEASFCVSICASRLWGASESQYVHNCIHTYICIHTHHNYLITHTYSWACILHYRSHTCGIYRPILWHNPETPFTHVTHSHNPTHTQRQISQILTGVCVTGVRECDAAKGAWVSAVTLHPSVRAGWLICQSSALCLSLRGEASPFYYWSVKEWFMPGGQDK